MLNKYIKNVVFIDDKYDEVEFGIKYFLNKGIMASYINPLELSSTHAVQELSPTLIFLDLEYFPGSPDTTYAKNTLRDITSLGHPYILYVWSQQTDIIKDFYKKIEELDFRPLYFEDMDKSTMLSKRDYSEFEETLTAKISKQIEAKTIFFKLFEWEISLLKSVYETVNVSVQESMDSKKEYQLENHLAVLTQGRIEKNSLKSAFEVLYELLKDNVEKNTRELENIELNLLQTNNFDLKMRVNRILMFSNSKKDCKYPGNLYEYPFKDDTEVAINEALCREKCVVRKLLLDITPFCTFAKDTNKRNIFINAYELKYDNKLLRYIDLLTDNYFAVGDYKNKENYVLLVDLLSVYSIDSNFDFKIYDRLRGEYLLQVQQKISNFISRVGTTKLSINKANDLEITEPEKVS